MKEIEEIKNKIQEEKDKINEKKKNQTAKLREKYIQEAKQKAKLRKIKIISEAKISQKKEIESKKEEIISNCFKKAQDKIKKIRDSKNYPNLIKSYVDDAKDKFGDKITILCDKRDEDIISKLKVDYKSTISTYGGIIAIEEDANQNLDYRFEKKLDIQKTKLRERVAKTLFM